MRNHNRACQYACWFILAVLLLFVVGILALAGGCDEKPAPTQHVGTKPYAEVINTGIVQRADHAEVGPDGRVYLRGTTEEQKDE